MKTASTPARWAASMSRQRSPTATLRSRSRSSRRAASRIIPGRGLRHQQPSRVVVRADHDVVERERARAARRASRRARPGRGQPRARSGWLVTTTRASPASAKARQASTTPGSSSNSSSRRGGTGVPSVDERPVEDAVAVEEDGRVGGSRRPAAPAARLVGHRASSSRAAPAARCAGSAQPRARILSVLIRTTGTSPFQPRSPPVYSKVVAPGLEPEHLHRESRRSR